MSGLFSSSHGVSSTSPVIAAIQLQTSAYGRPITWVFGQQRVAPNLIQYDDFTAVPHTTTQRTGKGGGGTSSTDYTYTVAAIMALSSGPVDGVGKVWKDKDTTTLGDLKLDFYNGDQQQAAYPYFVTTHPDRALAYRGIAYVASGAYDLDTSASFGNHTFEVQAPGSIGVRHAGSNVPDAEVADVVTALLTDTEQGVGLDPSALGDLSAFRSFCLANSLWVSPAYTDQKGAYDYIKNLLTIGFSDCLYSGGVFKIVPYSDVAAAGTLANYVPTISPVYDLGVDDFITDGSTDPIRVTQKSADEAYNDVQVKFSDRANDYNDNIAESSDDADIALNGVRMMPVVELPEIADGSVAQKVADFLLHRSLYILNTYVFRLPWKYILLEPMDVVTLTYPNMFMDHVPVLITDIEEDDDGLLTITAEDYPIGSNSHSRQPPPDTGGSSAPNYAVAPGNANPPLMFEPPPKLTNSDSQLWMAVSGGADWGGAVVWASTDDKSYQRIGMVQGRARHGVLLAPLAAGAATDTVHTLSVDLSLSRGELQGATQGNAQDLLTTCYVDGEYIAYANEALTGANRYSLSYLVRGAYGSSIGAHAAGAAFAFLDTAIFRYSYPNDWIGKTLYIKLASVNAFGGGLQDLSEVTAYEYTLTGTPVTDAEYLNASGRVFGIQLDWGLPADSADTLQYTELWSSVTPSRADATKLDSVATPQNQYTVSGLAAGVTLYFWVRLVDKMGNASDFYPAGAGVEGQTSSDATDILSYLGGEIGKTQLAQDVLSTIQDAQDLIGPVMDQINALLHGAQDDDLAATQLLGMISADQALSDARNNLTSTIGSVAAAVTTESAARMTATDALATQITSVAATTSGNTALILQEQVARTTAVSAVASQLTVVAATVGQNTAAIQTEQTARASATDALASRIDSVVATTGQNTAAIVSEQTARANADGALSTRIDTVLATSNGAVAAIQSETSARTSADGALSSRIDTVTATANGASATAQAASSAISSTNGQLSAMYTIKAQTTANGHTYLASLGVGVDNSSGVVESQILLAADRFAVISEANGAVATPFVVQGGQVFINQAFIATASIQNAQIGNAAVDTLKIGANAVTVPAFVNGNGNASGIGTSTNVQIASVVLTFADTVNVAIIADWQSRLGSTGANACMSVSINGSVAVSWSDSGVANYTTSHSGTGKTRLSAGSYTFSINVFNDYGGTWDLLNWGVLILGVMR